MKTNKLRRLFVFSDTCVRRRCILLFFPGRCHVIYTLRFTSAPVKCGRDSGGVSLQAGDKRCGPQKCSRLHPALDPLWQYCKTFCDVHKCLLAACGAAASSRAATSM